MDRWLSAIEADVSDQPLPAKVLANKPTNAVDSCWIDGQQVVDQARCDAALPWYGDARIAAGAPLTVDVLKCALKPPVRSDYGASFSDAQWTRLQAAFPAGVCDWTRPGIDQVPSQPWTTFTAGPGGEPLGLPPSTSGL